MQKFINRMLFICGLGWMSTVACQRQPLPPVPPAPVQQTKQAIINGTKDLSHPAVGTLVAQRRQTFCTGTLITSQLVLTAAHCVDAFNDYRSRGARVEFRTDTPSGTSFASEFHAVQSTQNHPQWTGSNSRIDNDLGVLVLTNKVTTVSPIPVNTTPMDSSWVGRDFFFLGYGLIQTQPRLVSADQKYSATIPVRRVLSDRFENYKRGTSVCSGDSGGPALYTVNGTLVVMGVNSYVRGNSAGRQPLCDGYSASFRTDAYMSWLQPLISQYGGTCQLDADCGPCYTCNNKKCERSFPTPVANLCKPCAQDSDCGGAGNTCVQTPVGNRCAQTCDMAGCCPQGYTCGVANGQKQCVPEAGTCADAPCMTDAECGPGEICQNNVCRPAPVTVEAGACKPCNSGQCTGTQQCIDLGVGGQRCLQTCQNDNFCPDGYDCQETAGQRLCVPKESVCRCATDTDCESGEACENGVCQRPGGGKYGDTCSNVKPCADKFQCVSTNSGADVCVQPCGPSAPGGGGSEPGNPGSYCNNSQCILDAQCVRVGTPEPVCFPQRCSSNNDCTNGGQCVSIQGAGISICMCQQDSECKTGYCNTGLFTQFFGQRIGACANPPKTQPGSECEAGSTCTDASSSRTPCGSRSRSCICRPSATPPACGNGSCDTNAGENCGSCAQDCACPDGQSCQNNTCQPVDNCGDGVCNTQQGENCDSCAQDCGCAPGSSCEQGICKPDPTPDTGDVEKGGQVDENAPLNCPKEDQTEQCDANGQNCKIVCVPTQVGCSGCNSTRPDFTPIVLFMLLGLLSLRRRRRA